MSDFVLDASATFAWFFDDEASEIAQELEQRAIHGIVHVPSIWGYEIANGLRVAEKRGRIRPGDTARFHDLLRSWTLAVDPPDVHRTMTVILAISRECELTSYDAAYLELAQRLRLPLATHDRDLIDAAGKSGVRILGEHS